MNIRGLLVSCVAFSASAQTIAITLTEGIPATMRPLYVSTYWQWFKNDQPLPRATNNTFTLEYPVEGDAGTYMVRSGNRMTRYQASFQRQIRVIINSQIVLGDQTSITSSSKVELIPCYVGAPIRYTLDGSEPTYQSQLYKGPFTVTNGCVLRSSIIIPEGDSVKINRK